MAQFVEWGKLLPQETLERFKYEVANELGLPEANKEYWGDATARDCGRVGGKIGGRMVRVLIRHAEEALARGNFKG